MATMTMDFGAPRIAARPRTSREVAVRTATPVRLTARGRVVVRAGIVLLVALVAFVVMSYGKAAVIATLSRTPATTASVHTVVVQPGQTLWQIAVRELPGIDPRDGIGRIRTLNGLSASDSLVAGQALAVPVA